MKKLKPKAERKWICPKCKAEHIESEKMFGCWQCGYNPTPGDRKE